MHQLRFVRPLGFRLAAATQFYRGFTPGSGMAAAATDGELTLAFGLDGTFAPVAVVLREEGEEILARYVGCADPAVLRAQLARILGLDADGAAWRAVGERDPVIGALQRSFPGFFTAAKASPYDAATWAVIAPRMTMPQAARIKSALARAHGAAVALDGVTHHVFPAPAVLAAIEKFPGLSEVKLSRLRGVAAAALAGKLDVVRLAALGEEESLATLQQLRGVGPWAASHIYYRGVAPVDALPSVEPRVLHGVALAYGIERPIEAGFATLAEGWRPFRMWVSILMSRHLAHSDGWRAPELARERAAAGQRLAKKSKRYSTAPAVQLVARGMSR